VEDHVIDGGFGSAVLEAVAATSHTHVHLKIHGVPDEIIGHGTPQELYAMVKLDAPGIANTVKNFLRQTPMYSPATTTG
jgi:1-deoxy-D-xylulose-5-phosphate synthase